ncbi:hypothetical protein [Clostridium neonatale]|uniref:hypothetical protein n=1 Tax=Clostridium neonatale TaxID=137838 RepID=UPI00291BD022|nr:hypothetical protein [Clostridium neonatale]CAI3573512.1 Conserved hypothetical protein [Clostridium neonatale]CAI3654782.1 Conserved hypothetical protein [Clostridium neonatale]
MNNAILQARKAHRKAIESQYEHTCTIKEYKSVKDPVTKVTSKKDVVVLENQHCRLSYESVKQANQTEANATVQQVIKLFIAPEIEVKEGSKIFITHEGRTTEFKHSGKPAIYSSHQEIVLELVDNA